MRRLMVGGLAAPALLLAALLTSCSPVEVSTGPSHLESATFSSLAQPRPQQKLTEPPEPRFTRAIYASVKLAGSSVMLDACHGPIAIDLGDTRPMLVAEHDYCGGSAWMPKLGMDDAVRLSGDGIVPGTYVVTEIRYQIRREAKVRDLPETDLVLQTCVTKQKMVLVGLERFDPTLQS